MFRAATEQDLMPLRDLEREANRVALAHVFPPEQYPFPDDAVLARWRLVMDDPEVAILVVDEPDAGSLRAYVAHDGSTLRHLAVRPRHWGEGLATAAVEIALRGMHARGGTAAWLWCLEDNHRARRLYEFLGWSRTGEVEEAAWPPHPAQLRYTRLTAPAFS